MKWIIYIILPALLVSCDLFDTRDPEGPDQTKSNYTPPSEAKKLIENIINSFADKNTDNYRKSFESVGDLANNTFTFIPSSAAQVAYQGIWDGWDVKSEVQYFSSVITSVPDNSKMTLSLSTDQASLSILGDSAKYSSTYSIWIPQIDSDTLYYHGNVEFTMRQDSRQIWVIYYWKDYAIGGSPSWSDLKGTYAN